MRGSYPALIAALEKTDPKFFEQVANIFELAMAPGELDAKTKILIAMALDAMNGSAGGVKNLSNVARHMGITDAQIAEVMRIVYLVAGNGALEISNAAFEK